MHKQFFWWVIQHEGRYILILSITLTGQYLQIMYLFFFMQNRFCQTKWV